MSEAEDQERVARELAEELRRLRIEDVLIQTLITVSSLGYRRLGLTEETKDERDLQQAKLAIETMRALTPVLEATIPADLVRDFNQSVASMQLAYAEAAAAEEADGEG
ncbi:MAG TPA: hypothetical protein VNB65_09050 [Gaiellaceae bacterium]|nr:hypothetical protein [Gaiellaceae bacterium]